MAYLLQEYSNEPVDIAKVMLMCLIHDIVEIDAGDTYAYDAEGLKTQKAREDAAKERIFSLLPDEQKEELTALFDEFEAYETPESKFDITRADARAYIDSYLGAYPKVKQYLEDVVHDAKRDGYVTTYFGRRRYIPELSSGKKMEVSFGERVAMNSPIQGTAADIIKLAMVNTAKKLAAGGYDARLILQVHDELIIESAKSCADAVGHLLKTEMENAVSLSVPLTVEISSGDSWYEAK